jgi:hypothetical protein
LAPANASEKLLGDRDILVVAHGYPFRHRRPSQSIAVTGDNKSWNMESLSTTVNNRRTT